MTFGQQPRNRGMYEPQGTPGLDLGTGAAQRQYAAQGAYDTTAQYSYEQVAMARRVSVARAYGEMTIGLLVTMGVALLSQATGLYVRFLMATGMIGMIGLAVVQVALAVILGVRIMKMSVAGARAMFYVYAALMGLTLSTILSLTTKLDMTKFGPVLLVGLVVLLVTQVVLMFVAPSDGMLRLVCAIGVVLFAGMTMYDAQQTRAIFSAYESQGPEAIRRVSILCALNLYLDFVNMFLYILQLLGSSRD